MKLRRIEVQSFRNLAGACRVTELGDGLTVLSGDNEEGKSSLLAALRAAFFEKHTLTGAWREAMGPYGREGTPEVRVDFEIGGTRWQLSKAFRRNGCFLDGPPGRLTGEAAERRLQELLRFERPGSGASQPAHRGLQALFWVEQGTTFTGIKPTVAVRDRLGAAVQDEIGAVAGGEGARAVMQHVEAQCARFRTPTGKSRAELKAAEESLASLNAEASGLAERVAQHDAKVDRLARLRADQARRAESDAVGQARERLTEARRRLEEIEALDRQRALVVEQVKAAEAELSGAAAAAKYRSERTRERVQRELAVARLREELALARDERHVLEKGLDEATAAEREAHASRAAAQTRLDRFRRRHAAVEAGARAQRLGELLTSARAAAEELRASEAALGRNAATEPRLVEVRRRAGARQAAQASLEASATRLEFRLEAGHRLRRSGAEVDPASPLLLTEPTELLLEGFGRVLVTPGGVDVAERRTRLRAAETGLAAALAELGAADVVEAERQGAVRHELEAGCKEQRSRLATMLRGAEADSLSTLETRLDQARGELTRLSAGLEEGELAAEGDLRAAEHAAAEAASALERRQEAAREAEKRLAGAREQETARGARSIASEGELTALSERLRGEAAAQPDEILTARMAAAQAALAAATARLERTEAALRLADPETVHERARIAQRALEAEEAGGRELEQQVRDLGVELRALGSDAAGERLAQVRSELEVAAATHRRLRIEARAWHMLRDALTSADAAVKDALLAPVRDRLGPLLNRLFPAADVIFDAQALSLTHLSREGVREPFEALSHGTREQLTVLVRLGLAQLLKEREGEAPCLILDDALVYADETRFDTMKAILQIAARELQIIVLTCRPRDYRGLDGRHLRLEDCITRRLVDPAGAD